MKKTLTNKNIILGISAGIAAYKTPDLVRKLRELGATVQVVMSENAVQFVAPLSLQAVSGRSVHLHTMSAESEQGMGHIDLARWADLILIAPATANYIGRLSQGMADELLSTICITTTAPIVIAPAMNQQMYQNVFTQKNLRLCEEKGVRILGPGVGEQACGEVGPGRMLSPENIAQQVSALFQSTLLCGKKVMLTAGPTWEAIDPVRGITNHSSGLMGYSLAQSALDAGAKVTLISGPTHLQAPEKAHVINVQSAEQMYHSVMDFINQQDIFIGVAAVSDYRPTQIVEQKIKKNEDTLTIEFVKNVDILAEVSKLEKRPFCVGFAAETEQVEAHARKKLDKKNLDMIAANHVGGDTGFKSAENAVTLITRKDSVSLPRKNKAQLAQDIMRHVADNYHHYIGIK